MDLDPFEPVGIGADTMRVLDLFLLHCLLSDSPDDSAQDIARLASNQHLAAARGREPGLQLERHSGPIALVDWAQELLAECRPIAAAVDAALGGTAYAAALDHVVSTMAMPAKLPAARVLDTMHRDFADSYTTFVNAQSAHSRDGLLRLPFTSDLAAKFDAMARESLLAQQRIEAADTLSFEDYRQQYLAPERLGI